IGERGILDLLREMRVFPFYLILLVSCQAIQLIPYMSYLFHELVSRKSGSRTPTSHTSASHTPDSLGTCEVHDMFMINIAYNILSNTLPIARVLVSLIL
ncbi:hypothetical protein PanWU01x14_183070, partial [Parasponia andersonii]